MSSKRSSIVRRLVAVTLAAGLLTGIAGVVVVQMLERRDLYAEAMARNLSHAERTATLMDGRIEGIAAQLRLLASDPAIAELSPAAAAELAVAIRVSEELDAVTLHDVFGEAVAAAYATRLADVDDIRSRPELAAAIAERPGIGIVWDDEHPFIEIAVPVEDPPGTTVGALIGRASLALISQDLVTRLLDGQMRVTIASGDGTVIADRDLDRVLSREVIPIAELFSDGRRAASFSNGGVPQLVVAAQLRALPGWVMVQQPESDAQRSGATAIGSATTVFLAVVAAIVGSVVVTGRRLLRPLRPLAEAVERLGGGQLAVRVETTGVGEARVLADGFNRMAESLEERQRQLEEAEQESRRSEERLRIMVEGVEDYAIVLLDRDGEIRSWNTGARRLLGHEADEAVGRPLVGFFDPSEPPPDPLVDAESAGRSEVEGWCRHADGRRIWTRIVVTALHRADGEPYGFAAILHDLTERRAVEHATTAALRREREAAEELRRANALKDEFLAIATHEIRTPLSAILGAGGALSDGWDDLDDDERRELRLMIDRHAQDMRLVVDRLLDFTRLQAGRVRIHHTCFDLRDELGRHLAMLERQLDDHVVVLDAPRQTVNTDRDLLRHVVTNLLSNAGKFSPAGSTIHVRGEVRDGALVISVEDEGVGIATEDQEAIFELFRRASNEMTTVRGTGVGLAIVRRYMDLVGGDVQVHSEPGRGSTFTVTVPIGADGQT